MNAPESRHIRFMSLLGNSDRRAIVDYTTRGCFHNHGVRIELTGGAVPRARAEGWQGGRKRTITRVGRGTLSERDLERLDGMIDLFFVGLPGASTTMESVWIGWYDGDEFIGEGTYFDCSMQIRDDDHVLHVGSLAHRLFTGETEEFCTLTEPFPLPGRDQLREIRADREAHERAAVTELLLSTLRKSPDAWAEAREVARRLEQDASSPTGKLERVATGIKQWVFAQAPRGERPWEPGFGSDLREALIQGVPGGQPTFRAGGPEHVDSDTDLTYDTYLAPVDWRAVATELLGER